MAVELAVPNDLMNIQNFPKYEYTFKIMNLLFDAGLVEVQYMPVDERFTKVLLAVPIPPTFDPEKLSEFVEHFAPHDRWFAQEKILSLVPSK